MNNKIHNILFSIVMVSGFLYSSIVSMPGKAFAGIEDRCTPGMVSGIGVGSNKNLHAKCADAGVANPCKCNWDDTVWHNDFVGICTAPVNIKNSKVPLSEIIQIVQKNVNSLKEQIINFVSIEEFTFEEFNNSGKKAKTLNILSDYRVVHEQSASAESTKIISEETRNILSVKEDGKEKYVENYADFITAKHNPYDDLFIWFNKDTEKCFDYRLDNSVNIKKRKTHVIRISPKRNVLDIGQVCRAIDMSNDGFVYIDTETTNILRSSKKPSLYIREFDYVPPFNYTPLDSPKCFTKPCVYVIQYEYDYGDVMIGDQAWRLPISKQVKVEVVKTTYDMQPWLVYKYRYIDHKTFTVGTKIWFPETD